MIFHLNVQLHFFKNSTNKMNKILKPQFWCPKFNETKRNQEKMIYAQSSLFFYINKFSCELWNFYFKICSQDGGKKLMVSIKELNSNGLYGQCFSSLTWCNIITYSKYQDYIFLANMSKMVSSITNYILEVRMK